MIHYLQVVGKDHIIIIKNNNKATVLELVD